MSNPLRVDFHDGSFHFNDLYREDAWEPETKAVLERFLTPGSLFVDVGSWIGPVSMWAVHLGASVLALEPDMEAMESLLINVEGYPVTTLPVALSDHDGVSWLTNPRFYGDSQSRLRPHGGNPDDMKLVNTVSPETLLAGIEPALVKIDIEGHETVIMESLTDICRARGIPLHISWHEPWWTWKPDPRVYDQWFAGFELEGSIGGWGTLVAVP